MFSPTDDGEVKKTVFVEVPLLLRSLSPADGRWGVPMAPGTGDTERKAPGTGDMERKAPGTGDTERVMDLAVQCTRAFFLAYWKKGGKGGANPS